MGETTPTADRASTREPEGTEILLMLRRCRNCGKVFAPPADRCVSCRSHSFGGIAVSGSGTVVSWRALASPVRDRAQPVVHTVAIVELDEGPWVYAKIEGELPASRAERAPVRFRRHADDDALPVFAVRPARVR